MHTSTSVYFNDIDNLINYQTDPADGMAVPFNSGGADAKGIELELEGKFPKGIKREGSAMISRRPKTRQRAKSSQIHPNAR